MYYSPRVREDLIPRLYRAAKARRIPMTRLVSQLLEMALENLERGEAVHEPPAAPYQPERREP